jgi:hypothetical protein
MDEQKKLCKKCGKFPRHKERTLCYECEKERQRVVKQEARKNPAKYSRMLAQSRACRARHPDRVKEQQRYRYECGGGRERKKEYDRKNRARSAEYTRNRRRTNKQFHLAGVLRGRLYDAIIRQQKRGSVTVHHSAVKNLGCTMDFFIKYIEAQMTPEMSWDNYGKYWSIDHILPLSSFDLEKEEEVKIACHYLNLRPLTVVENSRKGSKIIC